MRDIQCAVFKDDLFLPQIKTDAMSFEAPEPDDSCLTKKVPPDGYNEEQINSLKEKICNMQLLREGTFVSANDFSERFQKLGEYIQRLGTDEFFEECTGMTPIGDEDPGSDVMSGDASIFKTSMRVCAGYGPFTANIVVKMYNTSNPSLNSQQKEIKKKMFYREMYLMNCMVHARAFPFFAFPLRVGQFKKRSTQRIPDDGFAMEDVALKANYEIICGKRDEPESYVISDNTIENLVRTARNRLVIDGIMIQLICAVKYMREHNIVHHDLHWKNVYLTPVKNLYGMADKSYLVFNSDAKALLNMESNLPESSFKINGILKIIDWDNSENIEWYDDGDDAEKMSKSRRKYNYDSLAMLRCLRNYNPEYWKKFEMYMESFANRGMVKILNQYLSGSAFGQPDKSLGKGYIDLESPLDILQDLVDGEYEIRRFTYVNPDDKSNLTYDETEGKYVETDEGEVRFRAEKIDDNMYFVNAGSDTTPHHIFEFTENALVLYRLPIAFQQDVTEMIKQVAKMRRQKKGTKVDFAILVEKRQVFEQYTDDDTFYGKHENNSFSTETDTTYIMESDLTIMIEHLFKFAVSNVQKTRPYERCFPFVRTDKRPNEAMFNEEMNEVHVYDEETDNSLRVVPNSRRGGRTTESGISHGTEAEANWEPFNL